MKLIYEAEDKLKFGALIICAVQQLLAIMAATLVVPIITGHGMSSAAALFGGHPNAIYGESVACVAITRNASAATIHEFIAEKRAGGGIQWKINIKGRRARRQNGNENRI